MTYQATEENFTIVHQLHPSIISQATYRTSQLAVYNLKTISSVNLSLVSSTVSLFLLQPQVNLSTKLLSVICVYRKSMFQETAMDIISRFIATSTILLHVLVILRGQNDLVTAQDTPYIIFGNRAAIHRMGLDGSNRVELHNPPDSPSVDIRGLDFDFNRNMMYWSDVTNEVIMRSRLDGSGAETIVSTGLIEPENIAWDWVNQKLYWTDKDNDTIKVYDPIRNIQKILVNTGAGSQPRAIVVDPSTRYLYWTDWSRDTPRIVKTSMDGKNSTVLANQTWVTWPNALAIDYANQVLYWGDADRDRIGRVSTNGSDIQIVTDLRQALGTENSHPWAMSYYNGNIYWSDWLNDRTVLKMDVTSRSDGTVVRVISGVGGMRDNPTGIHVVDASRQSSLPNPCGDNNGGCSDLCLLSPTSSTGFTCACPFDIPLNENGRHCGDLPATTTSAPEVAVTTPSQSIGPCNTSNPCSNGASCLNLGTGATQYFCVCINGYSGRDCQISPVPEPPIGDSNSNTVIAVVLVFGGIVVVIVVALVMIIVLYVFYKVKNNGKAKERSQSFSALSTTSSRDSPTHIVIYRNSRSQPEHDYASIKSRDSPAPKGNLLIYSLPNGNGNHYVYPQQSENVPMQSFQRVLASNGTLNGYLGSSMEKSDSSTKDSDTEPFYSNVKSKTNTL